MNEGIYLLQDNGDLIEMNEKEYDSEDLLQKLLERYPKLIPGSQVNSDAPRRWLLISREVGLPFEVEGSDRWSIDHLFLDQDAIPTIVEVKRSTDSRIRREVIGQVLDYAANAVVYWSIEKIRSRFETYCETKKIEPDKVLNGFLGDKADTEIFWQNVKTNLQAGKIRLLIVADEIPSELQRIVEFLNAQMDPAEILAVEIKQFVGKNLKTLVPRVIGQTGEAQQRKTGGVRKKKWDEISFFQELEKRNDTDVSRIVREMLEWSKEKKLRIWWGEGGKIGSFYPMLDYEDEPNWLFSVWTYGRFDIQFQFMKAPFDNELKRLELLERINKIPDINIPADSITKRPSADLTVLKKKDDLKYFFETFEWVIDEIKHYSA